MIVVSPHLDDAVLSCGMVLSTELHGRCTVVTVCAGVPGELPLTVYDAHSGFTSGREAVEKRRREDERALTVLDHDLVHLDVLDGQYGVPMDTDAVVARLRAIVADEDLLIPLGLGHPDHVLVASLARAACSTGQVVAYEELPYRVLDPRSVPRAAAVIGQQGWTVTEDTFTGDVAAGGSKDLKRAAIACYRSQAWALDPDCLLVPERYWRLER